MSALTVTVPAKIITDDKYCGEKCRFLHRQYGLDDCILFGQVVRRCLGGGPLRCEACVAAETKTKETK